MRKVSFADMNCSIAQALEIIGEWWTLLIVRDCFLGIRRFDRAHESPREPLCSRGAAVDLRRNRDRVEIRPAA